MDPRFYDPVEAAHFPRTQLRYRNQHWAEKIGLSALSEDEWVAAFGRFNSLPHNLQKPLALRYHGHQFGHYNPDLGDGRGFIFAQLQEKESPRILDLGTKGSGQTPWSRQGDGRLTLKGGVREVLATSYLEAHGVNTSKTFSLIETGEKLQRGDEPSPTRSSVLVRLSHGHVRIGSFQRLAFLKDTEGLRQLLSFCLSTYYPDLHVAIESDDIRTQVKSFFSEVCRSVALTTAQWMNAGFVHGVLNTDNINVSGESFDYGPYRFLPYYDPEFVAAYFDRSGLYAFGHQPRILHWNLQQLALSLSPLTSAEADFAEGYDLYEQTFNAEAYRLFLKRLQVEAEGDLMDELFSRAFHFLLTSRVPFEGFFLDWIGGAHRKETALQSPRVAYYHGDDFNSFFEILKQCRSRSEPKHPYFQQPVPVTLLIDEIESLWKAIDQRDDWSLFENKLADFEWLRGAFETLK